MLRCQYSDEGKKMIKPRKPDRQGTIVQEHHNTYSIKWDGSNTIKSYYKDYIKILTTMIEPLKQIIVMRTDLNMRKGKMIAQGAHATLGFILNSNISNSMNLSGTPMVVPRLFTEWVKQGMPKICVGIDSEQGLLDIVKSARENQIDVFTVTDAGHTEFKGIPTLTCAAIGPASKAEIDRITGHLKLL